MTDAPHAGALRIELFVRDLERAAAFYHDVLGFERAPEHDGYISVTRGAATIGLGRIDALPQSHPLRARDANERRGVGVEVVVEVEDVDAAHAIVAAAGWPVLVPTGERPWGLRDFRLLDPDAYYIRITSR
jgi:catechol 2,3-dioxygenase-like lactoylglutathione lyase family enzyme